MEIRCCHRCCHRCCCRCCCFAIALSLLLLLLYCVCSVIVSCCWLLVCPCRSPAAGRSPFCSWELCLISSTTMLSSTAVCHSGACRCRPHCWDAVSPASHAGRDAALLYMVSPAAHAGRDANHRPLPHAWAPLTSASPYRVAVEVQSNWCVSIARICPLILSAS